jgi:hypothetical protein
MRFSKLAGVVVGIALAFSAKAQWSSQFGVPGANEKVQALVWHDDGSGPALYVGGHFSGVDNTAVQKIARYRNGVWSDVGGGIDPSGYVNAMTVFNGELVVAGKFEEAGGVRATNIARWDGATWQPFGSGLAGTQVNALAVFDGQLVASANALGVDSTIARWDGTAWQPMGSENFLTPLIVYKGELIAYTRELSNKRFISRWTGSDWESIGALDDSALAFTIFNDELIVTGDFSEVDGVPINNIARWNGAVWQPLGEGGYSGPLTVHEGNLVVGNNEFLAQWNGTSWSSVQHGLSVDYPPLAQFRVSTLLSTSDGDGSALIVGGSFTAAGTMCVHNIARYANGQWSRLSECEDCLGLSHFVQATAVHDDGTGEALYVAGSFRFAGTQFVNHVARWDGDSWSPVGDGFVVHSNPNLYVNALMEFDDGSGAGPKLYAGGTFYGELDRLAVWDGVSWLPVPGQPDGSVVAMTVFDDGSGPALYVGGHFDTAGGQPVSNLAKWDGRAWSAVGGGVSGENTPVILDMLVWDDGSGPGLVVGGMFATAGAGAGAITANGIARWRNGEWSTFGDGLLSGYARCLAAWPPEIGDSLVVGGSFSFPTSAHGTSEPSGLALWDGETWQDIAPVQEGTGGGFLNGTHDMHTTLVGSCNQLFIHGHYTSSKLQVWNGTTWKPMAEGISQEGWHLVFGSVRRAFCDFTRFQDHLYVTGSFTSAGGLPANNIAIWDPEAALACAADVTHDGEVNVDDLVAVILQWGPCIECTADSAPCGGDGDVNIDDLIAVILAWGDCPR